MKFRSLVQLFLLITISIFLFGVLFLSWLFLFKILRNDYSLIEELGKNWSQGIITDIVDSTKPCKGGYENIIVDKFSGYTEGCKCSNFPLERGSCKKLDEEVNYEVFSKSCKHIPKVPEKQLNLWRGYYICSKREMKNYFDIEVINALEKCPDNRPKKCGKLDTLNNIYCVKKDDKCPINYIRFLSENELGPKNLNYTTGKNIKNLIFSNENEKGKILTNFKISDGEPCANFQYENSENEFFYILSNMYYKQSCTYLVGDAYYDFRYTKIDSYNQINLYKDNKIYDLIKNMINLPTMDFDINLYSRTFFGVSLSCKKLIIQNNVSTTRFILNLIEVGDLFSKLQEFSIIIFLFILIIFLAISFIFIDHFYKCFKDHFYLSIAIMVFVIMFVAINAKCYLLIAKIESTYYVLLSQCLDNINNFLINEFHDEIEQIRTTSLYIMVFSSIILLLSLLEVTNSLWMHFFGKCFRIQTTLRFKKKQSKSNNNEMNPEDMYMFNEQVRPENENMNNDVNKDKDLSKFEDNDKIVKNKENETESNKDK